MEEVEDALVDRHAAADAEDADRHDQAPEVELLAVAERVRALGGRALLLMPSKSRAPLPVSTSEWMPSEIIAELPVMAAAMNLMMAIARLPMIAAMTAFLDSVCAMGTAYPRGARGGVTGGALRYPRPMLRAVTLDFWNTLFVDHRGRERERRRAAWLRAELETLGADPTDAAIADGLSAGFDYFERVWRDERARRGERDDRGDARRPRRALLRRPLRAHRRLLRAPDPRRASGAYAGRRRRADHDGRAVQAGGLCDTGYSPGSVLRELLARHHMLEPFSYLFFSNEHGMSKPDPRVFKHTLAQLGVRAGEAAHVGDISAPTSPGHRPPA